MYYHSVIIILHRPPRRSSSMYLATCREGFETCEESLNMILRLLRDHTKLYGLDHLPMTFIHVIATAASIIFLKLHARGPSFDTDMIASQLDQLSKVSERIAKAWPGAAHIETAINDARQKIGPVDTSVEATQFDWQNSMILDWYASHMPAYDLMKSRYAKSSIMDCLTYCLITSPLTSTSAGKWTQICWRVEIHTLAMGYSASTIQLRTMKAQTPSPPARYM